MVINRMTCGNFNCPRFNGGCPYHKESMKAACVCPDYYGSRLNEYNRHVEQAKAAGREPLSMNEYFNC